MYQVLLIDDEPIALENIQNMLDWEKIGVEHVLTAVSVSYAKHILENFRIHLVICDIEMPEMNGIEFAEYVKKQYPDTLVIMLSCHAEFQYAQDAMRAGSIDYILKPVTEEVLEARIRAALKRLGQWQQITKSADKWKENEPVRKEWLLKACIDGQMTEAAAMKGYIAENELEIGDYTTFCPVLAMVKKAHASRRNVESGALEYSICSTAQRTIVRKESNGFSFRLADGQILSILENDHSSADDLKKYCMDFIHDCNKIHGCDAVCWVGKNVSLKDLRGELQTLQDMPLRRASINMAYVEERAEKSGLESTPVGRSGSSSGFEKSLEGVSLKDFRSKVEAYLNSPECREAGPDALEKLQGILLKKVEGYLRKNNLQPELMYQDPLFDEKMQSASDSAARFSDWFTYMMQLVEENLRKVQQQGTLVSNAKEFIRLHLSEENINRDSVAKAVFISPDYLSRIFKKQTGMGLNEYIVCCRIDIAKKLLAQTDLAVGTISAQLGYSSFSHFTQVFKEHVGSTPAAYRQSVRK